MPGVSNNKLNFSLMEGTDFFKGINRKTYETIRVGIDAGIARVTIDNPPVNLLGIKLMTELNDFLTDTAGNPTVKVIVFDSANTDFFIAHVDMTLDADAVGELAQKAPERLNPFQALSETLRNQPQITIIKLAGIARGGGAEFVAAADMSFAAIGRGELAQCEVLMGIVPGGGATQYLGLKMGRSRALEVILGADLVDAMTAERYGWINRAIPAEEIDGFVDALARHVASLPDGVISAAKRIIPAENLSEGFKRENDAWFELVTRPVAAKLIGGRIAKGLQTRESELQLEALLRGQLEGVG